MIFKLLLLLICMLRTHAYWQIKWNDEFDNDSDLTKWDVTNEDYSCDGNYIQQLNCKTNNSRNLRLIDGALAIAAAPESQKYLDKDFTSAMITTKESFTFGKFEVRAALPKGKMLRPAMYFIPTKNTGQWPKDGQIDLMTNIQLQALGNGIHMVRQYNQYEGSDYKTRTDLHQFHSYILEWNESMIIWKLDEMERLAINLTEKLVNYSNPFTSPFKLVITLGVGGQFFSDVLTKDDTNDWHCSLLILDYVRVYEWIDGNKRRNETDLTELKKRIGDPDSICQTIMASIRLAKKINVPFATIVSVLSLILMLVLIPFVVYLFNRQKTLRVNQRNSEQNYYEDTQAEVFYEDIKDNEYDDPYQPMPQTTNHYTNESISDPVKRSSKEYVQMTNKYV